MTLSNSCAMQFGKFEFLFRFVIATKRIAFLFNGTNKLSSVVIKDYMGLFELC